MSRITKVSRVTVEPQHWMDGSETACGLAIRTVRRFTAFWGCVTCPGCCEELQRRRAARSSASRPGDVDPARVFDTHGKTTINRFEDLLLAVQEQRRAS